MPGISDLSSVNFRDILTILQKTYINSWQVAIINLNLLTNATIYQPFTRDTPAFVMY
jgi:hypothetical protein